jgi:hypothetical protein
MIGGLISIDFLCSFCFVDPGQLLDFEPLYFTQVSHPLLEMVSKPHLVSDSN